MKSEKGKAPDGDSWLCKCCLTWNDEIDFVFYQLMTDKEKRQIQSFLKQDGREQFTIFFGLDQNQTYTGAELRDSMSWFKVPDEKTLTFLKRSIDDSDVIYGMVFNEDRWQDIPEEA